MNFETNLLACPVKAWKSEQVIAFDWYDGVRQGLARLSYPTCEFAFHLLDERYDADGLDDRLFRLSELPEGTVETVTACLRPLGEATKPVWVPVWKFQHDADKTRVSREVDALLARGRTTPIVLLTKNMVNFDGVWSVDAEIKNVSNWFNWLGISPR